MKNIIMAGVVGLISLCAAQAQAAQFYSLFYCTLDGSSNVVMSNLIAMDGDMSDYSGAGDDAIEQWYSGQPENQSHELSLTLVKDHSCFETYAKTIPEIFYRLKEYPLFQQKRLIKAGAAGYISSGKSEVPIQPYFEHPLTQRSSYIGPVYGADISGGSCYVSQGKYNYNSRDPKKRPIMRACFDADGFTHGLVKQYSYRESYGYFGYKVSTYFHGCWTGTDIYDAAGDRREHTEVTKSNCEPDTRKGYYYSTRGELYLDDKVLPESNSGDSPDLDRKGGYASIEWGNDGKKPSNNGRAE